MKFQCSRTPRMSPIKLHLTPMCCCCCCCCCCFLEQNCINSHKIGQRYRTLLNMIGWKKYLFDYSYALVIFSHSFLLICRLMSERINRMSSVNQRLYNAAVDGRVRDIEDCIRDGGDVNCKSSYLVCIW